MHILDIYKIDDEDQEFGVSMYIRQRWTDPRVKFSATNPDITHVVLNDRDKLWVPDTFFVNERRTKFSEALTENSFIKIFNDGRVIYSTRVHTTLSCPLNHAKFPFDVQSCSFTLESYGHKRKELEYVWYEDKDFPVTVGKKLTTKPFQLRGYGIDACCKPNALCEYSCLTVDFLLSRRGFGRYLLQAYLPITFAVALAYLCLWLRTDWTIKVFLSAVSILCTAILAAFASSLGPETNDCTALDAWGFWSVVLSTLPMIVLIISRLLTPKVEEAKDEKLEKGEIKESLLGSRVEKIAIYMFPLIFALYNFVYWANYANRMSPENAIADERKVIVLDP
ncbi:glutamate-gated chloride channel-like isoform X2 [Cloeon dipterum]